MPEDADLLLAGTAGKGIAVVTLNRPGARNALNAALREALYRTMADLEADPAAVQNVLGTYDAAASLTRTEALEMESRRSGEWMRQRSGGDFDATRRSVTERGSRQL